MPYLFEKLPEKGSKKKNEQKNFQEIMGDLNSPVTQKFFERLDDEIEGNPSLKEKVMQNIVAIEKEYTKGFETIAKYFDRSPDEIKEALQTRVEEAVEQSDFFVAINPHPLEQVLSDGRWKSQFETETSRGALNWGFRASAEMKMFGFNKELDGADDFETSSHAVSEEVREEIFNHNAKERPIYGYFSNEENGVMNGEGTIPPPSALRRFGAINVKIKKEVAMKKATITFNDSFQFTWSDLTPTFAANPHFTSYDLNSLFGLGLEGLSQRLFGEIQSSVSVDHHGSNYTEAQYHGGLTVDDIESVHISPDNDCFEIERIEQIVAAYNETAANPIPVIRY